VRLHSGHDRPLRPRRAPQAVRPAGEGLSSRPLLLGLLLGYAALLVVAGLWVARKVRGSADFFVAGRRLGPGLVFSTLLAANIGAGSTVGAAGQGYLHGLSAWWWSGSAAIGCTLLGLVVVPRLHQLAERDGFFTVGDFLERRYDRGVRGMIAALLALGSLSILAGQLLAMAWALEVLLGVPRAWGCLACGAVVTAYFSRGGLMAAAWVNLFELAVLLFGFGLALPFAWRAAGGWAGLSAAAPAPGYGDLVGAGPAWIFGWLVTFVPSFMISPGLVQKTFGARTAAAARTAALANAAALAVFAFVPALLGMAARATRPALAHHELALPALMADVLPGAVGALALAALFAAEVSTADAVLFMVSTSAARDLYHRFVDPGAADARLLRVARLVALGAGALGTAVAVLIPSVERALRTFYGVLTVALLVPLLVGLFSARATAAQARRAIVAASATTVLALLWWRGTPAASWLPFLVGLAAALACFAHALLRRLDSGAGSP
jgi:SSS family solute:Na+ symporter